MAINNTKPLRAGLIGCGSMGSFYMDELHGHTSKQMLPLGHAQVLIEHPRTQLVAGADPDQGRLNDFGNRWEVEKLYSDHREMLAAEQPDIVSIASPPDLHPEHVIDCAESGVKGIFCEKPIAPTLRQADELIEACEKNGAKLTINHVRRADPHNLKAREIIRNREIGDLLTVVATWSGRLYLTGTHVFDLVNFLVDESEPLWVVGHAESDDQKMRPRLTQRGTDIGGNAYIVYENGVRAFFNARDDQSVGFKVDAYGTQGMISIDANTARFWKEVQSENRNVLAEIPYPQMMRFTAPMVHLLDDLIDSIEQDRQPLANGIAARRALEEILATHHSSQNDNTKVTFPFPDLDMKPPYRWFDESGEVIYRAT